MARKYRITTLPPIRVLREYGAEEVAIFIAQWLKVYGKDRKGVNSKDYLWHIFSADRYPIVSGAEALLQYRQQKACEYVVFSNDGTQAVLTDQPPEQTGFIDFYVSPLNLAWTMAFTHEDGWLGPYFARHANYVALNEANLAKVCKAREAQAAFLKGWR